jgi:parvulin-like peptidyl-prolyl isomerase
MRTRTLSLFLLVLFAAVLAPADLRAEVVNRVVLRVNDQIATLYDYQQRREEALSEIARRERDPEERQRLLQQAPEIVFKNLYEELLLKSRADQLAIEVSPQDVDAAIAEMRQNFGIQTDEEFAAALAQSGLTEPQLREQVRLNLRLQEVRGREIRPRVQVDEEDLRRYYQKNSEQFRQPEQLQVREVVVLEEATPSAEERLRIANEIRQQVAAGRPLADVAAGHARRGVASNVIDHGWVTKGDLDSALEAAVWSLQPGAISQPVAARGGLHLLQVAERRESRIPPFAEVAERIAEIEQNRVYREEIGKYMAELEKRSLIVANPPQEAAGFRRLLGKPVGEELAPEMAAVPADAATTPALGTDDRPQEEEQGAEAAQAPGTLPEPKPVDATPPPLPPPPGVRLRLAP